jgi:uracil-DNA glycosylase
MPTPFDPGYGQEPFRTLVADVPDAAVFPSKDFRVEWGPVFHRGRLDGTARLLVIGQDPAQHEVIARRTLVGGAGHRLQGFLAKLGLTRSYVMVNTYVYSVFGQGGGNRHTKNAAIAAYRNRWFDALLPGSVQGVVALGQLADAAWQTWKATPKGATFNGVYTPVTHPAATNGRTGRQAPVCLPYRVSSRRALQGSATTPERVRRKMLLRRLLPHSWD